jgi:hypothetical protein
MSNVSSFHACVAICGGRADHAAAGDTFTLRVAAVMLVTETEQNR